MHHVNRAAAGLALILFLSLLLVSCNNVLFGRVAQAEPAWAHVISMVQIAKKPDDNGRYRVRVMFCCINPGGPMDCDRIIRGISVPKYMAETYALGPAGIPYAWQAANLDATHSCRKLL